MATKVFTCEHCGNSGKIIIKETELTKTTDLVYCPFCSADIYEPEFDEDDE